MQIGSQLYSKAMCSAGNFTLAILGNTSGSYTKVIAIDKSTKAITTLQEINQRLYDVQTAYFEKENKVYFSLQMETKRVAIYETDGTVAGTKYVSDIKPVSYTAELIDAHFIDNGQELYFKAIERESDGTSKTNFYTINTANNIYGKPIEILDGSIFNQGTAIVKDAVIYSYDSHSKKLTKTEKGNKTDLYRFDSFYSFLGEYEGNMVLTADITFNARRDSLSNLYITNGTTGGTVKIAENVLAYFDKSAVQEHEGYLYYFKDDITLGAELWRYDGNKSYLVEDVIPGTEGAVNPRFFVKNGALYFTSSATNEPNVTKLYKIASSASHIKLLSYADYNGNEIKEADEPIITNTSYKINEQNISLFTSQHINNIMLEDGNYTLSATASKGWISTSSAIEKTINLPEDNGKTYSFGFKPEKEDTKVDASLLSDATRCGFPTPYTLFYRNTGFTKASGTIKLKPEANFSFESASPAPNSISGDTLIWLISDLDIGMKGKITINFTMPGVESMGDTLISKLYTRFKAVNNKSTASDSTTLQQILTCSYDPNDIQANPAGLGEKHLTLKNKPLEYLVRFQNMGTDKAFNIVVKNELQEEFDLSTFQVIGSSHDMYTKVEDNKLSFHFDNIQLPYEEADEPGSHGYILYRIKPKAGLPDSTVLNNQAFIYFDYNPAIETNVTFNTLVDKLPVTKTVLATKNDITAGIMKVYPNPADTYLNISWPETSASATAYYLTNSKGQVVLKSDSKAATVHQLDIAHLPQGLYFLKAVKSDSTFVRKIIIR
ncbi:T9SS type A sorting domain-containing protein [Pontibacter rugosus]